MLEVAVLALLDAHVGLQALVGTRIYPGRLSQSVAYPAVTYQRISTVPALRLGGADSLLTRARVQVSAWDEDQLAALAVAAQIKLAMDRYSATTGGVVIQTIFFENQLVLDHPGAPGGDGAGKPIWQVPVDFEIVYEE